ncbi:MAG: HAMP domain-containing histidine kinase [Nitrosopumilus sp.]|nr:HAMP domain-containing histidine kinase [Nitrosopumilus sp.]
MTDEKMVDLLIAKIKEFKEDQNIVDQINHELLHSMMQLEKTKNEIANHRDKLELEIKEKTQELVKSERLSAIGELSARIAHDLLNPLNVIKTSSEILKNFSQTLPPDSIKKKWQMHEHAIERMEHQIKDVLNFIRKSPLDKQNIFLSKILKESMEQIMIPSNITINTPKDEVSIYCEPIKLQVVFVNLIMNAIQAINKKESVIEITASKGK